MGPDFWKVKREVLVIVCDVSDRKMMEQQMQYMSFHDALTSLYNRTYFEQEMKRLESSRYDEIGIMVCDVDGLKLINDSLGHTMGDKVLKVVAGNCSYKHTDRMSYIIHSRRVDAMTSDRPYRKAMRRTLAIAELKKYSGTQFDPTLVDLFVETVGAKSLNTRIKK